MARESLDYAIAAIREGRTAEVLDELTRLHKRHPEDVFTSYLFAYALEQVSKPQQAAAVWKSTSSIQEPDLQGTTSASPTAALFRHTPGLQEELDAIFSGDDPDDPIQALIAKLNTAPQPGSVPLEDDGFDDLLPEEEEQTLVSETLGRILIAQEKYTEAASVYRTLAEQHPDHRDRLLAEANRLRDLAVDGSDP